MWIVKCPRRWGHLALFHSPDVLNADGLLCSVSIKEQTVPSGNLKKAALEAEPPAELNAASGSR